MEPAPAGSSLPLGTVLQLPPRGTAWPNRGTEVCSSAWCSSDMSTPPPMVAQGAAHPAGQTDLPLSPLGRRQSRLLQQRLRDGPGFRAIYSSPLRRARDTARAPAAAGEPPRGGTSPASWGSFRPGNTASPSLTGATSLHQPPNPSNPVPHAGGRGAPDALQLLSSPSSGCRMAQGIAVPHGGPGDTRRLQPSAESPLLQVQLTGIRIVHAPTSREPMRHRGGPPPCPERTSSRDVALAGCCS